MRFCLVSTFYPPYNFGGDGIFAHRLANGLAQRGHQVTVIYSRSAFDTLSNHPPASGWEDLPGVHTIGLHTPRLGLLWLQQTGRAGTQARELRSLLGQDFDVIHFNNISLLGGIQALSFGRAIKLYTLTDHWLVCPTHALWRFDREQCTRPTCIRCMLNAGRPPQLWRSSSMVSRAIEQVDAFLGPSRFTIRMHRERGIDGRMVHLAQFAATPKAATALTPPRRPYFLYAGRLESFKGVQLLIPHFQARPDVDLLIAGLGGYQDHLRGLAAGSSNISFLGRVSPAEIESLYRHATASIVPSLCYETFGLVVAESFAAGTPVIVSDHSGLAELVDTFGGGLKFRNPAELGEAIDRLRSDEALRSQLSKQARAGYESDLCENKFLDRYLAIVNDLRERKRDGDKESPTHIDGQPVL